MWWLYKNDKSWSWRRNPPYPLQPFLKLPLLISEDYFLPSALINLTPLSSFITLSVLIYHLCIRPLIHSSPGISSFSCQPLSFISESLNLCFHLPSFCFLIFSPGFYIASLCSQMAAAHWTEGKSLDKSLFVCLSPLFIFTILALLLPLLLPPCICLSPWIPPFVYLLTSIHLCYLHPPPHTAAISLCPSLLLLSTAHKIQR